MDFKEVLESIFKEIAGSIRANLEAAEKGTVPDSSKLEVLQKGTIKSFNFNIDGSGNFSYNTSQYGAGVTVSCDAWVESPDASYSLKVKSSDGGGGSWENIRQGQHLTFKLRTSFFHNTKISVEGHASVSSQTGHGELNYSL